MQLIVKKPIFGYGEQVLIMARGNLYNHAHNLYLDFLLHGGVLALLSFIFTILFNVNKLDKTNNEISKIINSFLFIFLILFIFEAYYTYYMVFIILSLCVMGMRGNLCPEQVKA